MRDILQKTIYNEARGLGEAGMRDVASTIYTRHAMNARKFGGNDYDSICLKPNQYEGAKIQANPIQPADRAAWEKAGKIANEMRSEKFQPTNDYTHFDKSKDSFKRYEGPNFEYKEQRGAHHFFKER
jgi:Cell Wall Hydrolase